MLISAYYQQLNIIYAKICWAFYLIKYNIKSIYMCVYTCTRTSENKAEPSYETKQNVFYLNKNYFNEFVHVSYEKKRKCVQLNKSAKCK